VALTSSIPLLKISVFPFLLLAMALALLWLEGKRKPRDFARALSLGARPRDSLKRGAALFAEILALLFLLSLVFTALGINDSRRVVEFVRAQPPETLFVAVAIAPIAEELFFRGYLQKRAGVILASVLFAALHYSYGSIAEIIAAFFISVLIGLELRKRGDLNACILAHAVYNAAMIFFVLRFAAW
jgi:membrane protease YdiL (CAAX protease family)